MCHRLMARYEGETCCEWKNIGPITVSHQMSRAGKRFVFLWEIALELHMPMCQSYVRLRLGTWLTSDLSADFDFRTNSILP